jgi:hypothetical protein
VNVELNTSAPAEAHLLTCVRWYLCFKRELIGIWPIWSENSTSASPRARSYVPEFEKCRQVYEQPLGFLARKRQDLLGTWSKIIHHCVPPPGPLTWLKVDTTSAFQHLTSKPKEIEYCNEYQSSVLRGKSHRRALS